MIPKGYGSQGESCWFREIGNSCSPSLLRGGQVAPMKPIKWYGSHGSTFGPIDVVMGQQLPSRRYRSCPAALTQQRQLCSSVVDDDMPALRVAAANFRLTRQMCLAAAAACADVDKATALVCCVVRFPFLWAPTPPSRRSIGCG